MKSSKSAKSKASGKQPRPTKPSLASVKEASHHREGSKQQAVLDLLRQPEGATIDAMMTATDWQQHSVRGFLAGVVRRRLKLKLDSRLVDGKRMYRVAGSTGAKTDRSRARAH